MLADRFNITKLKDLAYSKTTLIFVQCGMVADGSDVDAVMAAVVYAFRNLPLSVQNVWCSRNYLDSKEKLLVYMARYIAWARDSFQENVMFLELLEACPDFAVALVVSSGASLVAPWSDPGTERLISYTSTTHILSRLCGSCSYQGVMAIFCIHCHKYDYEVGGKVGTAAVQGTERLLGHQTDFRYNCKWCRRKQHCNSELEHFTYPWTGKKCFEKSYMNPLVCRKCNAFGCMGGMKMPLES